MDDQSSEFVRHTSCSECGSSDANAVYSDLHEHCFSCGVTKQADGGLSPSPWADQGSNVGNLAALGSPSALPRRRLTEETCQKFGYTVSEYNGQTVQIANYKVGGKVVAQKIRFQFPKPEPPISAEAAMPTCIKLRREIIAQEPLELFAYLNLKVQQKSRNRSRVIVNFI